MNIGIIIGRIGGVDGVALEAEKWIDVFKRMGHKCFTISGQYQERKMKPKYETLIPEMSFFSPEGYWGQQKAFFNPQDSPDELISHVDFYSNVISQSLITWIRKKRIDVLVSENASALPAHLSLGLGIKKTAQELGIPIITHDHDFAWERGERYMSVHKEINSFVAETFPLRLPNAFHAVINLHGQTTLKDRFNRDSVVVPNVMNFDIPFGQADEYSSGMKHALGFDNGEIPIFQITRIVRRKGIETAIKLISELDDKRLKLIVTGSPTDDEKHLYYNELVDLILKLRLNKQVVFGSHIINNRGLRGMKGAEVFSLSDAYANARACTYFSTYEGFGNAFVEAVLAKVPIFVNNYKPVYWPDIGSKGFKAVMLEDNVLTPEAVKEMSSVIFNDKINKEVAEHNYALGKKYFSYDTLEEKLTELMDKVNAYLA